MIGVAKSRFHTAIHAVPVVTAAGMPAVDTADPVRHMADRYRLHDALRRVDTLARAGRPQP